MIDLIHGDCLDEMQRIPDKSIDLVVTDPPYKIVQGGCTNKAVRFKGASSAEIQKGTLFKHNDIEFIDWLPSVYRVLKDGSHCYIMCNDRNLRDLLSACEKVGFKLLNILVWGKSKHSPNRYYMKNCEFIVFLRKGFAKNINDLGTKQLLMVDNVDSKLHPSEKPVRLMQILVENSSNEQELVLDPFMGSCSVGYACMETNRNFIGIELDDTYFEIAQERVRKAQSQLTLL